MLINLIHLSPLQVNQTYPREPVAEETRRQSFMEEMATQRAKYMVHDGVIDRPPFKGIAKAHKKVIQYAKDMKMKMICVCEDDIKFTHPDSYKYFLKNMPEDFDMYMGLIYHGEISDTRRVMNGFSGGMTLYIVKEQFFDTFLNVSENNHIDNNLGELAWDHKYYVCNPFVCTQSGGYSFNKKQILYYDEYLRGKTLYAGES